MSERDRFRWSRVSALFDAALERPPGARKRWLREASEEDPEVLREVLAMLDAHERAGGILDAPVVDALGGPGPDDEDLAGRWVGPYRITRRIGRGGMAVVWGAEDPRLHRKVAVKFLSEGAVGDGEGARRLMDEARLAARLDHPSICAILDVGQTEAGRVFVVMPHYAGETLAEALRRGPMDESRALDIALGIAEGLTHAHQAGVVHRDIKPSNVLLPERGGVRILDFGIARPMDGEEATRTGARAGTLRYMAPEQVRDGATDPRTDLWALGAVLQEMLTGRPAFAGDTEATILHRILNARPEPPVRADGSALAPAVAGVIRRCLAPLGLRYHTAEDLAGDLVRCIEGTAPPRVHIGAAATRLPPRLTSFVGREAEVGHVLEMLEASSLVTLTGPGGAGKTRLALEIAHRVASDRGLRVAFVSFADLGDPALVESTLAQVLEIRTLPDRPVIRQIAEALAGPSTLLVLDNFERVLEAADTVRDLVVACPELKILLTSRIRLRVAPEREFPVPPLEIPDPRHASSPEELAAVASVALFVERARAAWPAFALDADNAAAVAGICARLDGLPLAVELAAARIRLFTAGALLERLGEQLDLLAAHHHDRPSRHRTLREAIRWSFELLDPATRGVLRRLSVMAGSWDLSSGEAVAADPEAREDVLGAIDALVEQSLVTRVADADGVPRFRVIHAIRALGMEELAASGEEERVRGRHADHFRGVARAAGRHLTGPEQRAWMNRLERSQEDLRSALDWLGQRGQWEDAAGLVLGMWRFWLVRGQVEEGLDRLRRILDGLGEDSGPPLRIELLDAAATLAQHGGSNSQARRWLEEALSLLPSTSDRSTHLRILNGIAWVHGEMGELDELEVRGRRGLELARALAEPRGLAVALNNLGWLAVYREDADAAVRYHSESLAARRAVGDERGIGFQLSGLAQAWILAGRYEDARACLDEADALLAEGGDDTLRYWARGTRADLELAQGRPEEAAALARDAERGHLRAGNRSALAWARTTVGRAEARMGRVERARDTLMGALRVWENIESRWGVERCRRALDHLAAGRQPGTGSP